MSARDHLRAHRLRSELRGRILGSEILVLEEATSTNDVVRQMASGDWPEGLVVFAERQTAGRGRRGHHWESAAQKGLWFSALLRPRLEVKDSPRLSEWAARAVAGTISASIGVATRVKLPNDVYVGEKKIAGVLVEMCAQPGASHVAVVGIGVNVNHAPTDFSGEVREIATSVAIIRGARVDRHSFALDLLRTLDRTYGELFDAHGRN